MGDAEQQLKYEQIVSDESFSLHESFSERDRTQSVSPQNIKNKYTLVYKGRDGDDIDMTFKIRSYRKEDTSKYHSNKPDYFELPSIAPKKNFMWAQYQRKRIKRSNKPLKPHGYWKLLRAEEFNDYERQISINASHSIKSTFSLPLTKRLHKVRENSPGVDGGSGTQLTQVALATSPRAGKRRKKMKKRL